MDDAEIQSRIDSKVGEVGCLSTILAVAVLIVAVYLLSSIEKRIEKLEKAQAEQVSGERVDEVP